jgi:hypothetical protein
VVKGSLAFYPLDSPLSTGLAGTDSTIPVEGTPAGRALMERKTKIGHSWHAKVFSPVLETMGCRRKSTKSASPNSLGSRPGQADGRKIGTCAGLGRRSREESIAFRYQFTLNKDYSVSSTPARWLNNVPALAPLVEFS